MTENELDRLLNGWKTPAPPAALRERVLDRFPRRERRSFWRPLRWAAAIAVATCMLAIGTEQASHGTLDNLANGVQRVSADVAQWFDQMWIAHIVMAFRNSNLKVYVDGELRKDVAIGGSNGGLTVRLPGEGKYYMASHLGDFRGTYTPARFDGHVVEFDAGGKAVRIESNRTYGFGGQRQMFMLGPSAAGQ